MFELLISKGADINAKNNINNDKRIGRNKGGQTPLHIISEKNSIDLGEILLSKGANLNVTDIHY